MAATWIKMRVGLHNDPRFVRLARDLRLTEEQGIFLLYRTAAWFEQHGTYGKISTSPDTLDALLDLPGAAAALSAVEWLAFNDGVLMVKGFCTVSASRKSLGRALREEILCGAVCAECGASEDLVVDHVVPVALGGSCDRSNLQALCWTCNVAKGKKSPAEWEASRGR